MRQDNFHHCYVSHVYFPGCLFCTTEITFSRETTKYAVISRFLSFSSHSVNEILIFDFFYSTVPFIPSNVHSCPYGAVTPCTYIPKLLNSSFDEHGIYFLCFVLEFSVFFCNASRSFLRVLTCM